MARESSSERLARNRAKRQAQTTKKNLKTMTKNGRAHKIRSASRIAKYGAVGFARNIWLSVASTLVMTITIIIILATFVASAVLSSTAQSLREKIDITIFFKPGTPVETLNAMTDVMMNDKNVRQVTVSTSEQEYEKFLADNASDEVLMRTLDDEEMRSLMIAAMQATMRVKVYNIDDTSQIERTVAENEIFSENLDPEYPPSYDTNRDEISTINSWANVASQTGWILSGIFIVISILVIFNTIRMAIFSRREEIYMMRLVGADNNFIKGPFLVEAQISGILSGVIATTVAYFGCRAIAPALAEYGINIGTITDIIESQKLVLVYLAAVLIGMTIGALSAELAIKKYLHNGGKK